MSMPEEMKVDLFFNDEGQMILLNPVYSPTGTTSDEHWSNSAYKWNELRLPDTADVAANKVNTLQTGQLSFTYLDVGLWADNLPGAAAGKQRNFGLVWGEWAAICEFGKAGKATVDPKAGPINEVLAALGDGASVNVIKEQNTPARQRLLPDPNNAAVYVILPDFHLPIATKKPTILSHEIKMPIYGPLGFKIGEVVVGEEIDNPEKKFGRVDFDPKDKKKVDQWYDRYFAGDIFRNAEADLCLFLDNLAKCSLSQDRKISLVQVGDMYDLWIGLERFFAQEFTNQRVTLKDDSDLSARGFIAEWVRATDANFPKLMLSFTNLPHSKRWLWGNHDNYFGSHAPTGLPNRERFVRENGIYIEHGQRADKFNCDGAISGHGITNLVFKKPSLRSHDKILRNDYLEMSAISYAHSGDFCVFAMGHTHEPYLTKVIINVKRLPKIPKPKIPKFPKPSLPKIPFLNP